MLADPGVLVQHLTLPCAHSTLFDDCLLAFRMSGEAATHNKRQRSNAPAYIQIFICLISDLSQVPLMA